MHAYTDEKCSEKEKFALYEIESAHVSAATRGVDAVFGGHNADVDVQIDGTFLTLYGVAATLAPLICSRGDGKDWHANERVDMSHGCPRVGLPAISECKTLFGFMNFAAAGSVDALHSIGAGKR